MQSTEREQETSHSLSIIYVQNLEQLDRNNPMEENWTIIRLNIDGMTCINCQNRIEEALQRFNGVEDAVVSFEKGKATVLCDESVTRESLVGVVQDLGYRVLAPNEEIYKRVLKAAGTLLVILFAFVFLSAFDVLNYLVPNQLADSGMGYGMLFVVGVLTSVHCIAMCGGINLSQCLPKQTEEKDEKDEKSKFNLLPAVFYNLGRVLSYTVIGFLMGLIGFAIGGGNADVGIPVILQGILKLVAGVFMVVMGLNMLGIFPWLRKFIPHMPASLAKKINLKKQEGGSSFLVGVLNGVMPCGPLQSMWIVALATGNPFAGALSMFLFALGTVPLMLGLGTIVVKLGQKFAKGVMTVGSALVVILGIAMLSQGGALTGWLSFEAIFALMALLFLAGLLLSVPLTHKTGKRFLNSAATGLTVLAIVVCVFQGSLFVYGPRGDFSVVEGDMQTVTSTLSRRRYPEITVTEGIPVRWVINAEKDNITGCNNELVIQDYDITYKFHEGENIIEFLPEGVGTVSYCCWMGMIYGTIHIVSA